MSKIKAKNTLYNDPRYDVVVDSRMLEQHLKEKDQQIAELKQQLHSQPAEIVEKINGEIYTRMVVEYKETKYTDINLILNTILKEYQK